MRFLVIEDQPLVASLLENGIRQVFPKASITLLDSINHARQAIQNQTYDVITVDKHLPDGDGFNMIQDHIHLLANKGTQWLYITGDINYQDAFKAYDQLDTFKVIHKPLELDQWVSILKILKSKYRMPQDALFTHTNRNYTLKVTMSDILYFEYANQRCKLVTTHLDYDLGRFKIKDVLRMHPDRFLQVHKSFVINKDQTFIIDHKNSTLIIEKYQIPIGSKYKAHIKEVVTK